MNPLRLQATNLGVFPSVDLTIPEGCAALAGPNGSGKSTLLNAIELALFADGSRDLAPRLGPYGDALELVMEFDHGSERYRIRRRYKRTASGGTAWLDFERHVFSGANGTSDAPGGWNTESRETTKATQAHIEAVLGLTRATFNASAFLGQGNAGAFPDASPADRKALLGTILDPRELWPRLAELARADVRQAEQEIAVARAQADGRNAKIAAAEGLHEKLRVLEGQQAVANGAVAKYEAEVEATREARAQLEASAERMRSAVANVNRIASELERARDTHDRASKTYEAAKQRLFVLRAAQDGEERCDRCRQTLGAEARQAALQSLAAECGRLLQAVEAARAEISDLEEALLVARDTANKTPQPAPLGADPRPALDLARKECERITHDLIRARQQAEQLHTLEEEARAFTATATRRQSEFDTYKLAERAFGRDGIPVLLVEQIIPVIEAEANRLLEQMPLADGATLRVRLMTQREQKTVSHLKETLDIIVSLRGGERPYETFSGGEQARLNVCLRIALAVLLADRRGAESRILCLDEVEYLDALGQAQLVDVVRSVAGRFSRVLCVSHHENVRDAFDSVVEVVMDGDVARVANGRELVAA